MTMAYVASTLPKISILTPFYNAGPYIAACIQSILDQNYSNWELILVNDFSDDDSLEIAHSFCKADHRIQLLTNKNKGLIEALRLAYDCSSGEYITRMDADDIMVPDRLQLMLTKLREEGMGNVCIGKVKYFSEGELGDGYKKYESWLNTLTENESNFEEIYRECSIPSPNFLIHRSDLDDIGAFNHQVYPEDYDLAFRMHKFGLNVTAVKEVTLLWRDHASRSTRTQGHYQPLSFIPLKVSYFTEVDLIPDRPLLLWGAGKKGKIIAKELLLKQIDFIWITDNPKKAGHSVYEKILVASQSVDLAHTQIILAVSNLREVTEIKDRFLNFENVKYWQFF